MKWLATLALILSGFPSARVLAHDGAPAVRDFHISPEDASLQLLSTNVGPLLSRDGGQTFAWICHEAMLPEFISTFEYLWLPDGSILAAVGQLVHSTDGCAWETLPGFEDLNMTTLAGHPTQRELVYAASLDNNVRNRVFRSNDGGETFTEVLNGWAIFFNSIRLAPSRPQRVYISGFNILSEAWLYRSDDGGDTFEELPITLPAPGGYRILGVSPVDPDLFFTTFLGRPANVVYRSTDGGDTFAPVLELDEDARRVVFDAAGRTLWLVTTNHIYRSVDTGETFTRLDAPSREACALRHHEDTLYGCGNSIADDFSLAVSENGGDDWQHIFSWPELNGPLACPPGSPVEQICNPIWPRLDSEIDVVLAQGGGADTGTVPGSDVALLDDDSERIGQDCGSCAQAPPPPFPLPSQLWLAALGTLLWWRKP